MHNFIARDCVKIQDPSPDAGEKLATRLVGFDEFLRLADDPDFYEGELKSALLRARFDRKEREIFRKLIFGNRKN